MFHPNKAALSLGLLLAMGPAFGQGQPNAPVSRNAGLDVLSVVSTSPFVQAVPGGITLTVHAAANSTYDLILETTALSADYSLFTPLLVGPLTSPIGTGLPGQPVTTYFFRPGLTGPPAGFPPVAASFPLTATFTDPNGGTPGVIPAGQTSQTLVSTFQLPVGSPASFQALVTDSTGTAAHPATTSYMTDGQQRLVVAPPTTLATSGYSRAQGAIQGGNVRDVEQGDIDGDGDLDEALIGSPFNGWTFSTVSFSAGGPMRTNTVFTMGGNAQATSGELVDLNDDGFLDFVIGASAISPTAQALLFRGFLGSAPGGLLQGGSVTVIFDPALAGFPMDITDLETGDFNGDGLPDVYAACASGNCMQPELNRLFFGSLSGGSYSLVERTGNFAFHVFDDSEDCEVFDFEGDGDLDIVVANYDGGSAATFGNSVNLIHINDGTGNFTTIPAPDMPVETADVLAVDIDRNGFDDLYFGNFLATDPVLCLPSAPVPDSLFLNFGGVFTDATSLIPGNKWPTLDVEAVSTPMTEFVANGLSTRDFDGDGDIDIFVGLGSFGNTVSAVNPPVAGTNRGVLILVNQQTDMGIPAGGPLPTFFLDKSIAGLEDVTDIEFGDWLDPQMPVGRWFEKDFGMATWSMGSLVFTKNP